MSEVRNILIVEDNPGDADLVRFILEDIEQPLYVVHWVSRLQDAAQHLQQNSVDSVILDLGLPDSEGLESIELLVKKFPELPIVVLTGNEDEKLGVKAVQAGAQDFIPKGHISRQVLARVLRYALERKQAEIRLRATEQQLQTILDALDMQVLLMDMDHRIKWPNRSVCTSFKMERSEIIGKYCYELWPDQDTWCESCPVDKAIMSRATEQEYRRRKLDKIWDIKACPVYDSQGRTTSIVELRSDITGRIQLEEQFFQAQKMEAIGRLAGGVAHDFNNMLSVILGFTELAQSKVEGDSEINDYLDEVFQAGIKSADLVRQLLSFSRKVNISPQILNCNDILEQSKKMLARLVGEDIDVRFFPGPDLWAIKVDPTQLDQIIVNLAVNSRDAIRGVGIFDIRTENFFIDDAYCRRYIYARPGKFVRLLFSDTGHGMTQDVLDRIFEPFFTTKEHGRGTGLGMSTIYGIVKQNEGIINVMSEPGKGTTVEIFFPMTTEEEESPDAVGKKHFAGGMETILVVEDEPALLRIYQTTLARLGYKVLVANSPVHALELFKKSGTPVDLLITDAVMPQMNGMQLKNQIESIRSGVPTIFISGYPDDTIAYQGVLGTGVNFLQKPFSREQLSRKIREVLDRL